jgi:hypothetical protein
MNDIEKLNLELANVRLEKRLCAANLIIGLHGIPKMCSQCRWEKMNWRGSGFYCSMLNIPSGNDKRAEKCPYDVFEGKA